MAMSTRLTLESYGSTMKDLYPLPGTVLKQWVVDTYREDKWERETCPRFTVPQHDDNTGTECRNCWGDVMWTMLDHDCCYECGEWHRDFAKRPEVVAWLAERVKRPPIENDRTKLSDQVAKPWPSMKANPWLAIPPRTDGED
jgi:hypothetical protein